MQVRKKNNRRSSIKKTIKRFNRKFKIKINLNNKIKIKSK